MLDFVKALLHEAYSKNTTGNPIGKRLHSHLHHQNRTRPQFEKGKTFDSKNKSVLYCSQHVEAKSTDSDSGHCDQRISRIRLQSYGTLQGEETKTFLIAHLLGEILRFATARGRAVPTSTKQKFVTTGLDLLETCHAAFLNINE